MGLLGIVTIGYCCMLMDVMQMANHVVIKKVCLALSGISFVFALLSFVFAYTENNCLYASKPVVVTSVCNAYDSPTQGAKVVKELHEGVLLDVEDEQQGGWLYAEMPDGNKVWLKSAATTQV